VQLNKETGSFRSRLLVLTGLTTSKTSIFDAAPAALHGVKLGDYFFARNTILWYYRFVVCLGQPDSRSWNACCDGY